MAVIEASGRGGNAGSAAAPGRRIAAATGIAGMSYANPAGYERFMGRWSARLAPAFLRFAGVGGSRNVLDVGCGTGSLSRALISSGKSIRATGIDPAAQYIAFARAAVRHPRAQFLVGAAEALPFADGSFDAALALLVLQDFGDPARAVREMTRVTRVGGVVAACLWDFRDGLPMFSLLWQAAEVVAPDAVARQRAGTSAKHHFGRGDLEALWRKAGLSDIETSTLELAMSFSSFDDYWQPFLGGATPTSRFVAAVDVETGGAFARALAGRIAGIRPDGSFQLPARALAVKGVVPAAMAAGSPGR
jgi:ubiquinone/menaquinone biosynthesis C-methylase UbiE